MTHKIAHAVIAADASPAVETRLRLEEIADWCIARWGEPGHAISEGLWYWRWTGNTQVILFFSTHEQAVEFKMRWM